MEVRKIIVISSQDQSQHSIMTDATTLGELKRDLDAKGISYSGMTFLEGRTKTEMSLDDAILPTNVPYRGETTNELVFLLTTPQKKIKSGADRSSLYETIKVEGLADAIKEQFGRHYTNVSTDSLEWFIAKHNEEKDGVKDVDEPSYEEEKETVDSALKGVYDALDNLSEVLRMERAAGNPLVSDDEYNELFGNML